MGKGKRNKKKNKVPAIVAHDIPTFDNVDLDDPEQHALPALVGLPHMKGAPLGMPRPLLGWISKRLWDCGYRYHPELRTIKYRPPHTGMGVAMLSSAGEWVPIDAPDPEPDGDAAAAAREKLAALPDAQKQQIVNALGLGVDPGRAPTPDPRVHGGSLSDDRVPYRRSDGTTVMVTPAQARQYANAKKTRKEHRS